MKDKLDAMEWENTKRTMDIEDLNEQLKEKVQDSPDQRLIVTKEGKQYNDKVRRVYMELLSLGVAVGKVSKVVKTVVEGITDKKIDSLPSKGLTSHLQTEAQIISQYQMGDLIMNTQNATLHLDGTKKKFKEYGSFQLSLAGDHGPKGLCLGIQEMATGEAAAYLQTVLSLFKNIAETFEDDPLKINQIVAKLVAGVKNLMTDRHIVNQKI